MVATGVGLSDRKQQRWSQLAELTCHSLTGKGLGEGNEGSPSCETIARTEQPEQPRRGGWLALEAGVIGSISAGGAVESLG